MSDNTNRAEQRAARKVAAHLNVSYTRALRMLRDGQVRVDGDAVVEQPR